MMDSSDGAIRIFFRVDISIDEQNRERVRPTRIPEGWFAWPEEILIIEGGMDTITLYPPTPPIG